MRKFDRKTIVGGFLSSSSISLEVIVLVMTAFALYSLSNGKGD